MLTAGFLLALIPALPPQQGDESSASIQKDSDFALALTIALQVTLILAHALPITEKKKEKQKICCLALKRTR